MLKVERRRDEAVHGVGSIQRGATAIDLRYGPYCPGDDLASIHTGQWGGPS